MSLQSENNHKNGVICVAFFTELFLHLNSFPGKYMEHLCRCSWCENQFKTNTLSDQADRCTCPACGMEAYVLRNNSIALDEAAKSAGYSEIRAKAAV